MSDKFRRSWFQLHLSTAIVLMFVAGGLLWANVHLFPGDKRRYDIYTGMKNPWGWGYHAVYKLSHFDIQEYGWPMTLHATSQSTPHDPETYLDSESMDSTMHLDTSGLLKDPSWFSIPVNVMAAMAILVCCALLCEWLISRREGRKP